MNLKKKVNLFLRKRRKQDLCQEDIMSTTRHSLKWILIPVAISLIVSLSCTQKNPLDATASILGNQPNLVGLVAEPDTVAAGGGISVIHVTLLDRNDRPMQGGIVNFALTGEGALDTTAATTDVKGLASVNFYSGTKGAQSIITATYGASSQAVAIDVLSASSGTSILLISSSKSFLYANGVDTAVINVRLIPDEHTDVENATLEL